MKIRDDLIMISRWGKFTGVQLHIDSYAEGGRLAIQLTSPMEDEPEIQEPLMTCTVNLPNDPCPVDEVWVKDYSENEGCASWLIAQGVIEPQPTAATRSGFVMIQRYKLTESFKKEILDKVPDLFRVPH